MKRPKSGGYIITYLFIQELLPSLPFRTWKGTFCRNCINHCIHRLYSEMWRNSFATTFRFITLSNHSHFVIRVTLFAINLVCNNAAGKCWLKIRGTKSVRVSTVSQPTTCQFDKENTIIFYSHKTKTCGERMSERTK